MRNLKIKNVEIHREGADPPSPALKDKGSHRVDHRFVIYLLHFHQFIASG